MINENNQETNNASQDEETVLVQQEMSREDTNQIDVNDNHAEEESNQTATNEYDANVYYKNDSVDWQSAVNRQGMNGEQQMNNQQNRRIGFFGQPMGQIKLPKITSKEEARKVFFGQSAVYYEKYYQKLQEEKKKISWNWAAFFLNIYWFFSRKMYVYGSLVILCKSMLSVVGLNLIDNLENPNMQSFLIGWAVIYLLVNVAVGMFANYLYISHMDSKIIYPGESELAGDDLAKVNIMRGGITFSGVLMCILVSDLLMYGLQYLMTLI